MPKFEWHTSLIVEAFSLDAIKREIAAGHILGRVDVTLPWCKLVRPLVLTSTRVGRVTLPSGFIFNGASIPRAARWWMSPEDPRIIRAAAWHDFLSPYPGQPVPLFEGRRLSSKEACEELYDGMVADGASKLDAGIVYRAVLTFGPKF